MVDTINLYYDKYYEKFYSGFLSMVIVSAFLAFLYIVGLVFGAKPDISKYLRV